MNAQSYDSTKRAGGSVCVYYAAFYRPWSPTRHFWPLAQRESSILVPSDQPIPARRLVEESSAKWKCFRAKNPLSDPKKSLFLGQGRDRWMLEDVANSCLALSC